MLGLPFSHLSLFGEMWALDLYQLSPSSMAGPEHAFFLCPHHPHYLTRFIHPPNTA